MARRRAPSHGPQRFETRYGECSIEQGTLYLNQGFSRLPRKYVTALKERDFGTFGTVAAAAIGVLLTVQTALPLMVAGTSAIYDALLADPIASLLGTVVVATMLYPLFHRWYASRGPAEIRCSDVRSVERVDERTFEIEYKEGPETHTRAIKTPADDAGTGNRAREAFEEKGFVVEGEEF